MEGRERQRCLCVKRTRSPGGIQTRKRKKQASDSPLSIQNGEFLDLTTAEESKGAALATPYLAGIGCSEQHRAELGTISHGGGAGPDLRHLSSLSGLSHLLGARLAICPGRGEAGEGFSWSRCPVPLFQILPAPGKTGCRLPRKRPRLRAEAGSPA